MQGIDHLIEVRLNIKWDNISLQDKFLWDISDPNNNPEEFAIKMSTDLGLPKVFHSLIAM